MPPFFSGIFLLSAFPGYTLGPMHWVCGFDAGFWASYCSVRGSKKLGSASYGQVTEAWYNTPRLVS